MCVWFKASCEGERGGRVCCRGEWSGVEQGDRRRVSLKCFGASRS